DHLFDRFGLSCEVGTSEVGGIAGAEMVNCALPEFGFLYPPGMLQGKMVYLIGRSPGQIMDRHAWDSQQDWLPVWVVQFRGRDGRVIYCGTDIEESCPVHERSFGANPRSLRLWKEVI